MSKKMHQCSLLKFINLLAYCYIFTPFTCTSAFTYDSDVHRLSPYRQHQFQCSGHTSWSSNLPILQFSGITNGSRIPTTVSLYASAQSSHTQNQHQVRRRIDEHVSRTQSKKKREFTTLLRVGLPSLLAGFMAYLLFPYLAITLASSVSSSGALTVLSTDSSQFVQNFLSVSSLLFSILVGQTCKYFFVQQE
jgi:hypothetical protein